MDINNVIGSLNPYSVLKKLKFSLEKKDDAYTAVCPCCKKHTLQLGKTELLCDSPSCKFTSGNIIDYLAYHYDHDYDTALNIIFEDFYDKLKEISAYDKNYAKDLLKKKFEKNRSLFDWLINLRTNLLDTSKFRTAHMWFRRHNINSNFIYNSYFIASGADIKNLLELLHNPEDIEFEDLDDNEEFSISPYFANHYTIGFLNIYRYTNGKVTQVKLYDAKFNYFGLLQCNLHTEKVKLYDAVPDTLEDISINKNEMKKINALCVKRSNGVNHLYKPAHCVYMYKPDTEISDLNRIKACGKKFYVSPHEKSSYNRIETTWNDFVFEKFKQLVEKDSRVTQDLMHFLDSITLNKTLLKRFEKYLKEKGLTSLLGLVNESINVSKVVKFSAYDVISSAYGYSAQRKKDYDPVPFTNFIVDIEETLAFMHCDDVYYTGSVITSGKKYPITLGKKDCSKPDSIEIASQRAFKKVHNSGLLPYPLPIITDSTYAKCLPQLLRSSANETRPVIGIDVLGWDKTNDVFITPSYEIGVNTIERTQGTMHPQYEAYKNYTQKLFRKTDDEFYNDDVITILCIIISQLVRSYAGVESKAVKIKNDTHSRNLLRFIYRALGQKEYISINSNIRKNTDYSIEGLSNYPLYALCENIEKVELLNIPAVVLTSSGLNVEKKLTEQEYKRITTFSKNVLTEVVKYILDTEALECEYSAGVFDYDVIIQEGLQVLKKVRSNIDYKSAVDVPKLKQALFNITVDECKKYFKLDFENQSVLISFIDKLQGKRKEFYNEIKIVDTSAVKEDPRYIRCSLDFINSLTEYVYGKKVQLPLYYPKTCKEVEPEEAKEPSAAEN